MRLRTCEPVLTDVRSALRDLAIAGEGRRTFAVIGELPGVDDDVLMDLGRLLVRLDISTLLAVGPAGLIHAGAVLEGSWGEESRHVAGPEEVLGVLRDEAGPDDVVLVAGLPSVVRALEAAA